MNVLLVGGGGREAALAWALRRSPSLTSLAAAPGNAGIGRVARRVPIAAEDVEGLVAHARAERYDLVVIGPEAPLCAGLADRLRAAGIDVFGPSAAAARIEGSKVFAKELMGRHGIPTGAFQVFDDPATAERFLASSAAEYPLVVKADGLAAGKGVVIAGDRATAVAAATEMLTGKAFGAAGRRIVVEEMLTGREASCFVLADGSTTIELGACQDYKRAGDGDRGPNTGGMGTYSPSVWVDEATRLAVRERIALPTIRALAAEGAPFHGVLFIGLMLTPSGPKVLEYNARFGDPETQVLVPRLDGDWLALLAGAARGALRGMEARFGDRAAVCVVMAAGGYPDRYAKGAVIDGLDVAERLPDVMVFHAGTELDDAGRVVTSGGRVLGVTALGDTIAQARDRAYDAASRIGWAGEQHRRDIAADAVGAAPPSRPRSRG